MQIFIDITKLNKNLFLDFKITEGRGDISKLKISNKKIFLIDESIILTPYL